MLRSKSQTSVWEQEAKFVQDRISNVEKHFAELCNAFAAYTRKAARLRDKGDEIAKVIQTYAQSETINRSFATGLTNFSATLSVIGDYRDAEVQRFDVKIIAPLSQYATICKHARDDVKNTFAARDKELTRRRHLDKLRERNPRNRQMISQAESELMKASVEVSRVVKGLEEQIDSFEKRKLHDLKTILLDFVVIELSFHAKALELLTKAYHDVVEIDEVQDLEYSAKSSLKTNSSESVQIEEYGNSSEETESESIKEKPIKLQANSEHETSMRFIFKTVPPIPAYQKFLTMPMSITYS
ncbi:CBY1 interacting BAR domain containing protein Fam92 isoform X4 [Calliopsis andreniformis]|uniref:CBY1 interacting BAR domain containing protein Fam92 isoform X4 n=1 Tax=Calliopsis andreniformis TaxID=337506 RepID=UPI003FCCC10C